MCIEEAAIELIDLSAVGAIVSYSLGALYAGLGNLIANHTSNQAKA